MPSPLLLLKIARWPGRESTAPLPLFSGPSPSPCGRWKSRGCIMEIWRLISAQLLPGSPCSCPAGWVERCALRAGVRGWASSRLGHATSPCGRATRREKGGTTATLSRGTALHVHGHSRDTHRTSPHRADADPFYPRGALPGLGVGQPPRRRACRATHRRGIAANVRRFRGTSRLMLGISLILPPSTLISTDPRHDDDRPRQFPECHIPF